MNFDKLKAIAKHPYTLRIVVVVVAVGIGYAGGRYAQPAKIVEKEKIVTQEREVVKTVVQVQTVEKKVYVKAVAKNVQTDTIVTKHVDGTVTTETKVTDLSKINVNATDNQSSSSQTATNDTKTETQTEQIDKTITNAKSQVHLTLDLGVGVRDVTKILAAPPGVVVGVGVEKRVFGPLFMGAWVQTMFNVPAIPPYQLALGLRTSLEF